MLYLKPNIETRNLFLSASTQYGIDDLESLPACAVGGTGCDPQSQNDTGLVVIAFCAVGVESADAFNGHTVTATVDCNGGGQDTISLPLQGCSLQTDVNIGECQGGTLVLCSDAVPCSTFETCGNQDDNGPVSLTVETSHGPVSCNDVGTIGGDNNNG